MQFTLDQKLWLLSILTFLTVGVTTISAGSKVFTFKRYENSVEVQRQTLIFQSTTAVRFQNSFTCFYSNPEPANITLPVVYVNDYTSDGFYHSKCVREDEWIRDYEPWKITFYVLIAPASIAVLYLLLWPFTVCRK